MGVNEELDSIWSKWSWSALSYYPAGSWKFWGGPRKLVRISGHSVENWTRDLQNTKQS